jgi:cobalt-zinc-cadmium efflux system outer membrane protein
MRESYRKEGTLSVLSQATVLLLLVLLVSGCARLPRDAGFSDVEQLVAGRTRETLHWRGFTIEEEALEATVRELLKEEFTVHQAVRIALLNNASLQATLEELGISRAELVQAGLLRNPLLSASLRFPDRGSGTNLQISLVQEFLNVLSLPLRRRVAAARFEQVKLRTADAALTLTADVKVAFYSAQGRSQLLENRRMIEEVTELSFDAARGLHRAGNITDLALARQSAGFEQARVERMHAEADVDLARGKLTALLGLDPLEEFALAPQLPDLAEGEIPREGLKERALAERLDLAAARLEEEVVTERLGGARLAAIQPDLGVGVETERETDGTWLTGPGVSVNVPLFDIGEGAVAAERGRLRQARLQAAALEVQVRNEADQAYRQLLAARNRAEHYRRVLLPLHAAMVDETQLQYNAMHVGIFELLAAKEEELEADGAYVQTLQDYWIAHAGLARVVGGRLPEPVSPEPEVEDLEELFKKEEPDVKQEPVPAPSPHHDHHH